MRVWGTVLLLLLIAGCTQPAPQEPSWKVETVSANCGTVEEDDIDIRAIGNSVIITVPMQTSTPCYIAEADVTIDGTKITVEMSTESQGEMCIECIGKVVGRVTISDLPTGNYGVDVRAPDKAALTTVMIG